MKSLENKDSETSVEIRRMPDFEINGKCKNIIDCIRRVRIIYWIIGISVLIAFFLILMPDSLLEDFWLRIKAQGTLVILVLIFSIVSVSLVWKTGERIDVWIFTVFNMRGQRAPWVDWTMLAITQIGSSVFAFIIGIIYFLKDNYKLAYEIILGTLTLWLVVEFMKVLIRRTRPYIKLKNMRIVGSKAGGHSFPSGHTSQSFFLATLLLHYYQANLLGVLTLYAIASIVGITRIYVGMHYPRDTIGGAALGTAWGLFGMIVNNYFLKL